VKIHVLDEQSCLAINISNVKALVKAVIAFENQKAHEVTIHFVSKEKISALHAQFFDDPSVTDCISFPMDDEEEEYRVLGEVFVCPEVAIEYADSHQGDPLIETALYIVHGLLHLMGYDDIDEKDRKLMRATEKKHIVNLKTKGLLPK
jgi:probable rRNA maturation factor